MADLDDNQVIRCKVIINNPFFAKRLPILAKIYRAGFKPRRRIAKRFLGKPAKQLLRKNW